MLRALFLNRDFEFHGGVSNALYGFARGNQPSTGVEMRFASMMPPSAAMQKIFAELGAEVFAIGDKGYLAPAKSLRKLVKQEKIDAVVANSFKAALVAKIATVGTRVRVIHYVHAIDLVLDGKYKRKFFARMTKYDPILFISQAVRAAHLPRGHAGPEAVTYYGVRDPLENPDTHPYPRSFRAEIGIPNDALLLAYIGAFVEWKDHSTLIRAFEKLDRAHNAHLLLIGEAKAGSSAGKLLSELNDPRIHVLAPRPDAKRILGAADIYVHPSRREGFGLAVAEAMLSGKPVVATREGAFPEYIEDGRTGLLAEPANPDSFAEKIEMLARDPQLASRIGAAGRDACVRRFAPEVASLQLCKFLNQFMLQDNGAKI